MPDAQKIKRSDFATFLKTGETGTGTTTPVWSRMGKGITSQKITYNAQTSSEHYINEDTASNSVDSYAPALDTPQTAYKGDPVFDYVDDLRQRRAVGAECETEILLVYIYDSTTSSSTVTYAAEKQKVSVEVKDFGGDGGKNNELSYSLNFVGDAVRGTCTITDGVPAFTAAT